MGTSVANLDSTYTSIIQNLMVIERQPLNRLQIQKDSITVQKAIYSDLQGYLNDFQAAVKALRSTEPTYSFLPGFKTKVTPATSGATVLTATASSSAVAGSYNVAVQQLASEHRVRSDRQTSASEDLNLTGSFKIGLAGTQAATLKESIANTITGFETGEVMPAMEELASGDYSVEVRNDAVNGWQFRLLDKNGVAAQIVDPSTGELNSGWLSIPTAEVGQESVSFDTGRGLKITFGADTEQYQAGTLGSSDNPAAKATYAAAMATIDIKATDSLIDIASIINSTSFPTGRKVIATVVDNQLILSGAATGLGNDLKFEEVSGSVLSALGVVENGLFKTAMQTPKNALLSVNNMQVERTSNKDLTDVINGVTLNLASDAEGKTAYLDINADASSETNVLNTFITKYNSLMSYLTSKVATEKQEDGTYTRGALAGDSMFSSLRQDLIRMVSSSLNVGSNFKSFREIGLEIDDQFKLSIKDSSKFNQALADKGNLTILMDSVMGQLDGRLDRFTGASGYVTTLTKSLENEIKSTDDRIASMEERLTAREESLTMQYAQLQAQIVSMTYTMQQMQSLYGSLNQYS
jgi:flagellar hook-associated protein 2